MNLGWWEKSAAGEEISLCGLEKGGGAWGGRLGGGLTVHDDDVVALGVFQAVDVCGAQA